MNREKDEKGNLSVDTRRVTTENAPFSDFRETRKDKSGVLSGPSLYDSAKDFPGFSSFFALTSHADFSCDDHGSESSFGIVVMTRYASVFHPLKKGFLFFAKEVLKRPHCAVAGVPAADIHDFFPYHGCCVPVFCV